MSNVCSENSAQLPRLGVPGEMPENFLAALVQRGRESFTGLPTKKLEEWRQTDLGSIAQQRFVVGSAAVTPTAQALRNQYSLGEEASSELVLVNGVLAPELSRLSENTKAQIFCTSRPIPAGSVAELVAQHLGKYAQPEKAALDPTIFYHANHLREGGMGSGGVEALNAAGLRDAVVIVLPALAKLEKPIHVLSITLADSEPVANYTRILFVGQPASSGSLVETFVGQTAIPAVSAVGYLVNSVTELVLQADARLEYCRLQQDALGDGKCAGAYHLATIYGHLEQGAVLVSDAATLGSQVSRTELYVKLNGAHADATLNGLVLIGGKQHADNHTYLDHAAPECPSHELYKHVLGDSATGVFKGKILVRPGAQKTDAKQTSKTLLLSDTAQIDAQPALEIYADDVKCTHGTTTGPVDDEMIFYLRSRGISLEAARHLLTYAFAADITRRIKVAPVRQRLETIMAQQHDLPLDLKISADGK